MLRTPADFIPVSSQTSVLVVLLILTALLMTVLYVQGRRLKNETARCGIVSFELAWSVPCARSILASWEKEELIPIAKRQLALDFPFLLVYPLFASVAVSMLAHSARGDMAAIGVVLSWAVLAAAPLDAVENIALLRVLGSGPTTLLVRVATVAAGLKFSLLLACILYALTRSVL